MLLTKLILQTFPSVLDPTSPTESSTVSQPTQEPLPNLGIDTTDLNLNLQFIHMIMSIIKFT